jgi:hydrogenase maturation protease
MTSGTADYLLVGIGNPVLSDDAAGLRVARRFADLMAGWGRGTVCDVVEIYGLNLDFLTIVSRYSRIIVADCIMTGHGPPGSIHHVGAESFVSHREESPTSSHSFNIASLIALGPRLGYQMPLEIRLVGIEGEDIHTFGELLSDPVAAAIDPACREIASIIDRWCLVDNHTEE